MSGFCAPINTETENNLGQLRKLFNGGRAIDIDKKDQYLGVDSKYKNIIAERYGTTDEAMGEKMFDTIVWRSTYKPAVDTFDGFTDGDFRRIKNEIIREAKRLNNPKLGVLERLFGVKRGVMNKWAITSWMNKHINLATNYERNMYNHYLDNHITMAKLLRAEILSRDKQSRFRPGIKAADQLEKLERDLALEYQNPRTHENIQKINKNVKRIYKILESGAGEVLSEFREYLETKPSDVKGGGKRVLRTIKDERGMDTLVPFSKNVEAAGLSARIILDRMGKVLIRGLENHKKVVRTVFLNTNDMSKGALIGEGTVGRRVELYENNLNKEIKAIKEGVDGGDYFPHYLLETFIKIENILDKPLKELESNADENLSNMEAIFSKARQNLGTPSAAHLRRTEPYENFMSNPLGVIRKYSMDAIAFNRVNYIRNILYKGLKHLPRGEFDQTKAIRDYVNDIFTLAEKGYTDRPSWVNKTVRVLTGYEFFSKIGFGVATAARNTLTGLYYVQSVGNRAFVGYLRDWNRAENDNETIQIGEKKISMRNLVKEIEEEQGFRFEDLSSPLFTEGLLPTEGVRVRDVDIVVSEDGTPRLSYKDGNVWHAIDSTMTYAIGKSAILQKVTENFLRKHMFRFAFIDKFNQLSRGELDNKDARNRAKQYALDIVGKYAFEYAAHQKAPVIGGTTSELGAIGQVAGQFFHFPFSFLQMQSEILKKSKDAAIAQQWNSPDLLIPLRFAGLYAFTTLMSGVGNVDFHRLMENDTVDRIKDIYDVVNGKEEVKGRGYIGPAVGDLFFLASLYDFVEMPDHALKDLIVGYNDAYALTDEQKRSRLLSTINVEMGKIVTRDYKALQNGTIWNVMMHEFGLYPRAWTREFRKTPFRPLKGEFGLKPLFPEAGKQKKKKRADLTVKEVENLKVAELTKLYRAMGI